MLKLKLVNMKELIKYFIAFVFVICFYFLGQYFSEQKMDIQIKALKENIAAKDGQIKMQMDSINHLHHKLLELTTKKQKITKGNRGLQ